jgi:hypothetical protein
VDDATDMDEDDDGLAITLAKGIPSKIEKFIPNIQRTKDLPKDKPKTRYGIEIKINPKQTPSPTT